MLFDVFWGGRETDRSFCGIDGWFFQLLFIYFNQAIAVFKYLLKIYHPKRFIHQSSSGHIHNFEVCRTWYNFLEAIFEPYVRSKCWQVYRRQETDIANSSCCLAAFKTIRFRAACRLFKSIKNNINKLIILHYDFNSTQRRFIWYDSTSHSEPYPFRSSYMCIS